MSICFAPLLRINHIVAYIDDIFVQAETQPQMFQRLRSFHEALRNAKLKVATDKTFFFLIAVKFLGHIVTQNKIFNR